MTKCIREGGGSNNFSSVLCEFHGWTSRQVGVQTSPPAKPSRSVTPTAVPWYRMQHTDASYSHVRERLNV